MLITPLYPNSKVLSVLICGATVLIGAKGRPLNKLYPVNLPLTPVGVLAGFVKIACTIGKIVAGSAACKPVKIDGVTAP